ncbi:predicted protein [Arabidopsis lyrata subsp. lyrata]|uniref:Predicted protein n=1 Tax=Arabidopsis lyrata subsp. lyrata TaxID=81972 RepID=D7KCC4_ARALL|nr:predicted protein [Arabidopsis lyrata subsp. lyrata]
MGQNEKETKLLSFHKSPLLLPSPLGDKHRRKISSSTFKLLPISLSVVDNTTKLPFSPVSFLSLSSSINFNCSFLLVGWVYRLQLEIACFAEVNPEFLGFCKF